MSMADVGEHARQAGVYRRAKPLKSPIVKRSIVIDGHKTSVSLEFVFWQGLKEMAERKGLGIGEQAAVIDIERKHPNLSCAIRIAVLEDLQEQIDAARSAVDDAQAQLNKALSVIATLMAAAEAQAVAA